MEINIADLLERKQVYPSGELMKKAIYNKNIFITGSAGSIGNTILSLIMKYQPNSVICLDISEIGIYYLKNKFSKYSNIEFILGNLFFLVHKTIGSNVIL